MQAARLKARTSGQPVTVGDLTTESSLTVAQPDGRLTLTTHLHAARVKKDGAWTPVDATLARAKDGGWSPNATPSAVVLSDGGTGPLATLTDRTGRSLALTFPFPLPIPVVTGAGARYPEVLPGVDLHVTVTDQGAVREVLVVKDAKAAANPKLATLRLGTTTKDLTVAADQAGNLTVRSGDGQAVFTAPAPLMWDSSAPASPAKSNSAAPSPDPGTAAGAPSSSADGPGDGAKVRPIAVKTDTDSLTLTPDAALLSGQGTAWPLFIDPTFQPATLTRSHFAQVMEGCAGTPQYDVAQDNGQGVGYQHYRTNCYGMERSFYEFGTGALTPQMYIDHAQAYFYETYGAAHSCDATAPVTLKWTWGFDGGTNWNNQPGVRQDGETKWPKGAYGSCGYQPVNFDVTGAVRQVVQEGRPLTVGLYGDETRSTGIDHFMRFNNDPYVIASYTIAPNTPDALYTSPDSQSPGGPACNNWGNAGWIGMTSLAGDASNITLNAYASTAMPGANLNVNFHVWDGMADDGHGGPAGVGDPSSAQFGSSGWGRANIGLRVSDGHQYGWNATASDTGLTGPTSVPCYFNVDLTPPTQAQFGTLQAFPPLGSGLVPTAHAGDKGVSIKVSSTDPTPGGCTRGSCVKSGVRAFQYNLDDNIPPVGANTVQVTPDADGSASADIPVKLNPDQWGTHRLYVRAVDGAGNTQPQASVYDFYAPWNPATKVVPGDVDFDGTPDFLAPASNGSLTLVSGNRDFTATPALASAQNQSPEKDSWNNYLIAHRGSLTQSGVDDLFAYNKGSHKLYAYLNDATATPAGTPGHFSIGSRITELGTSSTCAGGIDGTWANLTQLVAPGAYGNPNGLANLITVEKGRLRLYPGTYTGGCRLGAGSELGDGDWSAVALLAPGTVGGTPTLWARDNVTGALYTYPLSFAADGKPTTTLHAPVHQALVSAVKNTSGAGMCADINGGYTDNGTPVQLWDCLGINSQTLTRGGDGTLHALGKCLDVTGGAVANGTNIQLWDCNNSSAQKWIDGPYPGTLQNPQSTRCLAVPGAKNTLGNRLILWDCLNNTSQQWTGPTATAVLPVSFGTAAYPSVDSPGDVNGDGNPDLFVTGADGVISQVPGAAPVGGIAQFTTAVSRGAPNKPAGYSVHSAVDGGKCLDNLGPAVGKNLAVWDCWNGISQKFTFAPDGTLRTGTWCVSVRDNATGNGSPVGILDCVGDPGQQWTLRGDGSLYNPASNRCMDVHAWDTTNGRTLDIWDCAGTRNELWTLSPNTA
ncbi:ricin-type beta-trefoil lectin domain protein [Kitasatospora sp. NPDC096128]|uniref:ricin-type beta-trefoil lectin domain protein n=1 Tax=Kitasatospora sp. NPDC096128 TaxID=3155547 RepID=UPI0033227ED5